MAVQNPTAAAPYVAGSPNYSIKQVSFRVQSAGAATTAPDFVIPAGAVTTPTHASTGVYTFVVPNFLKNGTLVSARACVLGAASDNATGRDIAVVSYVASTGVLTLHSYSRGTDAAAPALAIVPNDEWIMVDLVFAQDVGAEGTTAALA